MHYVSYWEYKLWSVHKEESRSYIKSVCVCVCSQSLLAIYEILYSAIIVFTLGAMYLFIDCAGTSP